jgi:hypothetical protein
MIPCYERGIGGFIDYFVTHFNPNLAINTMSALGNLSQFFIWTSI